MSKYPALCRVSISFFSRGDDAFRIGDIATMYAQSRRAKRVGRAFAARQPDDVMAPAAQLIRDGGADKARCAGDEYLHGASSALPAEAVSSMILYC